MKHNVLIDVRHMRFMTRVAISVGSIACEQVAARGLPALWQYIALAPHSLRKGLKLGFHRLVMGGHSLQSELGR